MLVMLPTIMLVPRTFPEGPESTSPKVSQLRAWGLTAGHLAFSWARAVTGQCWQMDRASGCLMSVGDVCFPEDFADEGGEAGAPGQAEGPADCGADKTLG